MIAVTVIYPNTDDFRFNFEYYRDVHLPLVAERWHDTGYLGPEAFTGLSSLDDGPPSNAVIIILRFGSIEGVEKAFSGEHAPEIMADVANFTNVHPIVQINRSFPLHQS